MSKTAVIFGVTGQAGSYLAELLLSKDYHVVGVSRRVSVANDERIRHLRDKPGFILFAGDVTDPFSVQRALARGMTVREDDVSPLEVYNLAAQSHVKVSFDEPIHTTNSTYLGCLNILEAIRSHSYISKCARFYQASSSEMFGSSYSMEQEYDQFDVVEHFDCAKRSFEEFWSRSWCGKADAKYIAERLKQEWAEGGKFFNKPFQNEETPFLPNSPYAIAKLAAHHAVRMYRDAYSLFACSGILFNHESPRRSEEFVTRKITKYLARYLYAKRHEEPIDPLRLGNLKAQRDWGHAEDYVRAMWLMLQQASADDYVVATGESHTVEAFLLKAFECIGVKAEKVEDLPVIIDPRLYRPSEVPFLKGDASKAKRVLGWKPEIDFDGLVKQMVYADLAGMYGDAYAQKYAG